MTFVQILEQLRDGGRYTFTHPGLPGRFHKAPYPPLNEDVQEDGALSAITFADRNGIYPHRLVMLLDDFDRDDWTLEKLPTNPQGYKLKLVK